MAEVTRDKAQAGLWCHSCPFFSWTDQSQTYGHCSELARLKLDPFVPPGNNCLIEERRQERVEIQRRVDAFVEANR